MHRRLWLNDPDCLMLRSRETSLTADERGALAAAIAASGGMMLISDDMALLATLGFNAYRFSIEWARIEPEEGEFSLAQLEHYRRMLAACRQNGLKAVVTLHPFLSLIHH